MQSVGISFSGKERPHYLGQKGHDVYSLIIEQYKYPVRKELWDYVEVGDEIEMHYAPKSRQLLTIEKNEGARL